MNVDACNRVEQFSKLKDMHWMMLYLIATFMNRKSPVEAYPSITTLARITRRGFSAEAFWLELAPRGVKSDLSPRRQRRAQSILVSERKPHQIEM